MDLLKGHHYIANGRAVTFACLRDEVLGFAQVLNQLGYYRMSIALPQAHAAANHEDRDRGTREARRIGCDYPYPKRTQFFRWDTQFGLSVSGNT